MRLRALVTHGVIALALLMPLGILAQLPDAPTPTQAVEKEGPPGSVEGSDGRSSFDGALETVWVRGAVWPAAADATEGRAGGISSSQGEAEEIAYLPEPTPEGQQPFSRPARRQSIESDLSLNAAYLQAIPGEAPALHNACPRNTCPVAETTMCCRGASSPFAQYLRQPDVVPLTARDNLRSAVKGVIDPFNLLTIAADAAIGIGSDSHTAYGPGFDGFAKYSGVSLTEDMTGEFFGTFLVPSLVHQDPHYHREPYMPIKHRILHAFVQIVWTQSYTGTPMFNYANFVGGAATAAVSNTFVPGPNRQGFGNTAKRLAVAFAISPSGNLIEEFLPDVASRINLRVVIFQRILNTVTFEESGMP